MMRTMIIFIAAVAAYDIYLTVRHADTLIADELNPIAARLITANTKTVVYYTGPNHMKNESLHVSGDVSRLVLAKTLGLLAAWSLLNWLMTARKRQAAIVIPFVACFQFALLITLLT